ncbi:hypothetical protein QUG53_23030, partial [Enterobacter asburiae]|uniref:hypothetical protein n=1 Tax=Enterobacter asburiae TaxID=61645 RepID=UPI0025A0F947
PFPKLNPDYRVRARVRRWRLNVENQESLIWQHKNQFLTEWTLPLLFCITFVLLKCAKWITNTPD